MAFQLVKNLSVRLRLLGFIFCLLLFIVMSGTGGLLGMRDTKQSLSTVYNSQVKPMEEMRQVNELLKFNVATTVEKVLYEQITWNDAIKKVEDAKAKIDVQIDSLMEDKGDAAYNEKLESLAEAKVVVQDVLTSLKKVRKPNPLSAE